MSTSPHPSRGFSLGHPQLGLGSPPLRPEERLLRLMDLRRGVPGPLPTLFNPPTCPVFLLDGLPMGNPRLAQPLALGLDRAHDRHRVPHQSFLLKLLVVRDHPGRAEALRTAVLRLNTGPAAADAIADIYANRHPHALTS